MKVYKPNDIFNFGKYKGEKLDFVFMFHPEYIEWLIINSDFFAIDIESFKDLHTCSFAQDFCTDAKYFNEIIVIVDGESHTYSLREYLTECMDLYKNHYLNIPEKKTLHQFSDEIISKNNRKILK